MKTMEWQENSLLLLDQTRLPGEVTYVRCRRAEDVAEAIKTMKVRGAPAIGAAAAFGLVLGIQGLTGLTRESFIRQVDATAALLRATRPTAVNLFWALDRMTRKAREDESLSPADLERCLQEEAEHIFREDLEMNMRIGRFGSTLIPEGARILTHCNAGALATAGYGTALGVVRAAHEAGKSVEVFADETRPLLQGARLTVWELQQDNIPVTLITDNMAGYLMSQGLIDLAVVGADRIAANGDTANKIGTYTVAVLCREHQIPFYVAAPSSTVDMNIGTGADIPIEERDAAEVTGVLGQLTAPRQTRVRNPAFDVTPARLISAIITDRGIVRPPLTENLLKMFL